MPHIDEDLLEEYVMRGGSPEERQRVEEHIQICPACLDRFDCLAAFVNAISAAVINSLQKNGVESDTYPEVP